MGRIRTTFLAFLGKRWLPIALAFVSSLLVLPAIGTGLQLDDFYHWHFLARGSQTADGRTLGAADLFNFLDGDPARREALLDAGVLPWWTSPGIRVAFWRPISGLTHRLDYRYWPKSPWLMHVQSFLWLAGGVALATLLYRKVNGGLVAAGLAALFFALDDAHGLPAGWLANRNAVVAGFFGILAILWHIRWRSGGGFRWMAAALLAWAAALLSGEMGMGAGAYLLAWALCREEGGFSKRFAPVVPYAIVFGVWLTWHTIAGYGAHGSGFYVDPASEPLRFFLAVATRGPVLLTDQFGLPPSAIQLFLDDTQKLAMLGWSVLFLVALALVFRPLLARDATARFWAAGMLLSVPLVCATIPNGRLLWFVGLGGFGLLGLWFEGRMKIEGGTVPRLPGGRLARIFFGWSVAVHLLVAPFALPANALSAAVSERFIQEPVARMNPGTSLRGKTLVFIDAPLYFYAQLVPIVLEYQGKESPRAVRVIAPGPGKNTIARVTPTALLIRRESGWLDSPFDDVFRDRRDRIGVGETIRAGDLTVGVRSLTPDGRPSEVLFRFDRPLEDSSMVWMRWDGGNYVPFHLPAPGQTIATTVRPVY